MDRTKIRNELEAAADFDLGPDRVFTSRPHRDRISASKTAQRLEIPGNSKYNSIHPESDSVK